MITRGGRSTDRARESTSSPLIPGNPTSSSITSGGPSASARSGARAVALLPHGMAGLGQQRPERVSQRPIIVDDKHVALARRGWDSSHRLQVERMRRRAYMMRWLAYVKSSSLGTDEVKMDVPGSTP